ncbi:MAG: outer membrane protein transport protein [Methylococcaceae bacterium]|nr:outer membrane protein transport protein [Methylococcaceae bacterium]
MRDTDLIAPSMAEHPPFHTRFLTCIVLCIAHTSALGDAYRIPYQGAAAAGQGEAFAAQADDASALHYNPAGITQLQGVRVSAGINLVGGGTTYTSPTGFKSQSDFAGDFAFPAPSNLYLTARLKDLGFQALGPLSLGIGVNSPYGLAVRYNGETPFSNVVTRSKLPLLDVKPTLAYEINDMLSVGFGLDIYTFASFIGGGKYQRRARSPTAGTAELNGEGTAVGFNASLLLTPLRTAEGKPRLNFGFVYRSGERLGLDGDILANGSRLAKAKSALELPEVVVGAIAFWPIRDRLHEWKLEYDMEFVGWDSFQSFDVKLSNGVQSKTPQRWHSVYSASFGTEYKWLEPSALPQWEIALRAGFQHSDSPIPSDTFNPELTDSDWNGIALGLGLNCKDQGRFLGLISCGNADSGPLTAKNIGMDLAFQAFFFDPRQISGNTNAKVNGTYQTTVFVGSLNFHLGY